MSIARSSLPANSSDPRRRLADNVGNQSISKHHYDYYYLLLLLLLLYPFSGLFSRKTWVSGYKKGETSLDLNEAKDDGVFGWQCHQLDHVLACVAAAAVDRQA